MAEDMPVTIRYTRMEDARDIRPWFDESEIIRWFPCIDTWEVDDSLHRWVSFCRYRASLSAVCDGKVVGLCTLYLQPYRKLIHHCELGIIVAPSMRGRGVGTALMTELEKLAREQFKIEVLSLQVYYGNPAIRLYERMGFVEYGRQDKWIREPDGEYTGRIFMQKEL
ncbi:MAG: GNAT family N-acetyltransferase [Chlamydiia bacterium]|nr:GNAT family N-acetyltransferase [Chlamydiia bacterium]